LIRMRASSSEFDSTWYCNSECRVCVSFVIRIYFTSRCCCEGCYGIWFSNRVRRNSKIIDIM
jgi:hypothetical protein